MVILIVALIIIIVVVFGFISLMKEEVFTMSKLRSIYLYLVSFVTLMMILGGLIFTVQNVMDVIFPTNYYYETYPIEKEGNLSVEEKEKYEANREREEENRRTESKKNVAKSIAVVAVALPTFLYHWKKVEQEKMEKKDQA